MLYENQAVNEQGHLTIGGIDTLDLAKEYGTPLYVLDENLVRKNIRIYQDAMKKYFREGSTPLYAGKALCIKGIYPIIQSEGMYADVVSPGEIYTALAAGYPAENLYFHGSNKTDEDIMYGLKQGVGHFITDNLNELRVLNQEAGELGVKQQVLLRVTVGIDSHTLEPMNTGKVDSQFGVPIETGQAAEFLKEALACENLEIVGFHSHLGSMIFESEPFCLQVDILLQFAADMQKELGFTAQVLNLGGGIGVPYVDADPACEVAERIHEISDHLKASCERLSFPEPIILMEPGRSIVAAAGTTLYTTGGLKSVEGYKNYVMIDGGMTDNPRFALYQSSYTVLSAGRMNDPKDFKATIAGRCCESGDRIQEDVMLPTPNRGDIIAVLATGAYNYAMSMNYNRIPRPALVIIHDGEARLSVRRQTFEDLIACESI